MIVFFSNVDNNKATRRHANFLQETFKPITENNQAHFGKK